MKVLIMIGMLVGTLAVMDSGVDMNESDVLLMETIHDLTVVNPDVSTECILVAAHIVTGRYNEIDHMMEQKGVGRCATGIVGLRARVNYDDTFE